MSPRRHCTSPMRRVPAGSSARRSARADSSVAASSSRPSFIAIAAASRSRSREAAWTPDRSARQASPSRPTVRSSPASRNQPPGTPGCWRVRLSSAPMACRWSPASCAAWASSHNIAGTVGCWRARGLSLASAALGLPRRRSAWPISSSAGGRRPARRRIASACANAASGRASSWAAASASAVWMLSVAGTADAFPIAPHICATAQNLMLAAGRRRVSLS